VLEVQAQLTNDPYDREPFHRKQPVAITGGEDKKLREDSGDPFLDRLVELSYVDSESPFQRPANHATYVKEKQAQILSIARALQLKNIKPRVVVETHPVATPSWVFVWTPNKITVAEPEECGRNIRSRSKHGSLLERLKHIFHLRPVHSKRSFPHESA
jgi:hypothetical protein